MFCDGLAGNGRIGHLHEEEGLLEGFMSWHLYRLLQGTLFVVQPKSGQRDTVLHLAHKDLKFL